MKLNDKEKIYEEWSHFCKCINFADSYLDARAVRFMNEFKDYLE